MHESQRVPHLVGNHVTDTISQHLLVHLHLPCGGIGRRRLQESPVTHQLYQIMVDRNIRLYNLPAPGIRPRGPHGVRHGRGGIAHAGIFQVIGIKLWIIGRKVNGNNRVLETDALESRLPFFHPLAHVLFPALGERVVHVKNDRLHGFHQFPPPVRRLVLGFQTPAVDMVINSRLLSLVISVSAADKYPDTGIGKPGAHRLFGQKHETPRHHYRERQLV